jgi:hypothetical protein
MVIRQLICIHETTPELKERKTHTSVLDLEALELY